MQRTWWSMISTHTRFFLFLFSLSMHKKLCAKKKRRLIMRKTNVNLHHFVQVCQKKLSTFSSYFRPFINVPLFQISPFESLYIVRFCWVSYMSIRFLFPPHSIARKLKYIAQVVWYKEIRTEPKKKKNGTKNNNDQQTNTNEYRRNGCASKNSLESRNATKKQNSN